MQQLLMQPNGITYNATISACEKGLQWIIAVLLLREVRECVLQPDLTTYNATISACENGQQWPYCETCNTGK